MQGTRFGEGKPETSLGIFFGYNNRMGTMDTQDNQIGPVLTSDDLAFFRENGYVIVRKVVSAEGCEAVIRDIFTFLQMSPDDPKTWYTGGMRGGGICHMHQTQSLWNNRQSPRLHRAFADVYGTEKLWVSMDRAGMKPPAHPDYPEYEDRGFLHWDTDTSKLPQPLSLQGVLCLRDTDETMGGFQCVPGFHGETLLKWIPTQPADRNPYHLPRDALPGRQSHHADSGGARRFDHLGQHPRARQWAQSLHAPPLCAVHHDVPSARGERRGTRRTRRLLARDAPPELLGARNTRKSPWARAEDAIHAIRIDRARS
jgi:hypothetical protein